MLTTAYVGAVVLLVDDRKFATKIYIIKVNTTYV